MVTDKRDHQGGIVTVTEQKNPQEERVDLKTKARDKKSYKEGVDVPRITLDQRNLGGCYHRTPLVGNQVDQERKGPGNPQE